MAAKIDPDSKAIDISRDNADMDKQSSAPGVAHVKKEYIRTREELYPSNPSDDAPPPPKKQRGQNKRRPRMKPPPSSQQLCHSVKLGEECPYGPACRFGHDIATYMASKPPDISDRCVFYQQWGRCPYGLTCRFGAQHTSPQHINIVDPDKMAAVGPGDAVSNVISKELQENLRKRKVGFPRSEAYLQTLKERSQEMDGRGQEMDGRGQEIDGSGQEIDGRGQEMDGRGQEIDGRGHEMDGRGQEMDGRGQEIDGRGQEMDGRGQEMDGRGQEMDGRGQEMDGRGQEIGGQNNKQDINCPVESHKELEDGEGCGVVEEGEGPAPEVKLTDLKPTTSISCDEPQPTAVRTVGALTDLDEARLRPLEKKELSFKDKLYLAPLTTVGNLPFRRVCKTFGADVTCGEMALCTHLLQGQQSEWALVKRHHSEDIFGVQVCGAFPDTMSKCAEMLCQHAKVDFIDINCGCPIDLIFNSGAGSALMKRPNRLEQIVRGMTSVMDVPLTVKMRTGVYDKNWNAHSLVPLLRQWGVSMVTVHGRSREQRYTKMADYEYINSCAVAAAPMPLFGNGDVLSYEDYNLCLSSTAASGLMIGRGALIKPWIFTEIKEQRHWDISSHERMEVLRQFTNYGLEHWGSDTRGVEKTRKFLLEWLSFLYRYIPIGLLERVPQKINERPPYFVGRDDLETLMASGSCTDWVRISEMLLGPVAPDFSFLPKHKANSYS